VCVWVCARVCMCLWSVDVWTRVGVYVCTKAINSNYAQTGRFNCYFLQTLCSLIIITLGRADTE
jgi:hypothetical protein